MTPQIRWYVYASRTSYIRNGTKGFIPSENVIVNKHITLWTLLCPWILTILWSTDGQNPHISTYSAFCLKAIKDWSSGHGLKTQLFVWNVPIVNSGYKDLCYIKAHPILQLFSVGRISQITLITSRFYSLFSLPILSTLQSLVENQPSFKL